MKRSVVILLALPVLVMLLLVFAPMRWKFSKPWSAPPPPATNSAVQVTALPSATPNQPNAPLLGETILRGYADTNLPPQNDLTLMSRLMENSLLLLKSAANRPLSANEDWAALFRGQNGAREKFLPENSVALNSQGQLIDRWRTPLFFHALGGSRYEIRSAGPDKKLWTADDIHRNADGSFRRGSELNPPSLFGGTNQLRR